MKPGIFPPSAELADFVMCYWTLESEKENTPAKNTIVPDGTMKLIFHYGDTYRHHPTNGQAVVLPKCFLIGQLTKPYVVEPLGTTGSFVVRFHPNGFLPFSAFPVKDMENTAVSLDKLFGEDGTRLGKNILIAANTAARIEIVEHFLLQRLKNKQTIDQIVQVTIETIFNTNGQISIGEHSMQQRINRRQLARKFSATIGLSPKQLAKIIRIQSALKKMLSNEVSKLTELAYEQEYFDQAHFIKDFKEFTGLTPKEFYGEDLRMSLIFDQKT